MTTQTSVSRLAILHEIAEAAAKSHGYPPAHQKLVALAVELAEQRGEFSSYDKTGAADALENCLVVARRAAMSAAH